MLCHCFGIHIWHGLHTRSWNIPRNSVICPRSFLLEGKRGAVGDSGEATRWRCWESCILAPKKTLIVSINCICVVTRGCFYTILVVEADLQFKWSLWGLNRSKFHITHGSFMGRYSKLSIKMFYSFFQNSPSINFLRASPMNSELYQSLNECQATLTSVWGR